MKKLLSIFGIAGISLLWAGCKPAMISEEQLAKNNYVLAKADFNYALTLPDFYDKIAGTDLLKNGGILDKNTAVTLLDSVLVDTLMGFRANDVNLRDYYEYFFRFRESMARQIVNTYYKHAIFGLIVVDSQEVLDYFTAHQDEFFVEEKILVYHIVITPYNLEKGADSLKYKGMSKEEIEESARKMIFEFRSQIDSKESFMEVAKKYSHDEFTARRGGMIDWANKGFYAWPFDSLAFAAKPGDIVGPYRDRDGWQILYIDAHLPAGVPQMNPQIYGASLGHVQSAKAKEVSFAIFDTLFANIGIQYNEELYDSNAYYVDRQIWAAIVNGIDTIDFGELVSGEEQIRERYQVPNSTLEMKKEMVQFLARRWVLVQTARKMGLDTLPEVVKEIESVKHFHARRIIEQSQTDPNWEPSDADLRSFYKANIKNYVVERPLKVQQILLQDSVLAEFVKDQAAAGADFLELADEYYTGEKSIRRDLAELGYVGPEDVSPNFFEAARKMGPGEVTGPVKTEYGFHIIKVLEANWSVPFENARAEIRLKIKEQHRLEELEAFKNGLYKEFNAKKTGRVSPMHFKPKSERQNIS